MRVFVSYHTPDDARVREAVDRLCTADPSITPYFAPRNNVGGDYWLPRLGKEIDEADAVLLVLGSRVGSWQEIEFYEAMRLNRSRGRPRIVPVVIGDDLPGLQFIHLFHRVLAPEFDDDVIARISTALNGDGTDDGEAALWRHANPYRGLKSMTSANAAFFFGRENLTRELIDAVSDRKPEILTLVGNSGVGKSSLVFAGLLSALRSRMQPGDGPDDWPHALEDSHRWQVVSMKPGERPLKELARAFTRLWIESDAMAEAEANAWAENLRSGSDIKDLASVALERLSEATDGAPPDRILLYVDQGEELYARSAAAEAAQFSAHLGAAASDPRLCIVTSLRSDFYGHHQADTSIFQVSRRIDVEPLHASDYEAIIRKPAEALGARFDAPDLIPVIAASAANEVGALPLVSYLMERAWEDMRAEPAGDGELRFPVGIVDVGQPLIERAEAFYKAHRAEEAALRRLFTFHLAHVPKEGEAVRKRSLRSEIDDDDQWALATALAAPDWRLLTLGEDGDEPIIEVAHETLLRRWPRLVAWIDDAREFLVWRGQLEADRKEWEAEGQKPTALLMGLKLDKATAWLVTQEERIVKPDANYIRASMAHAANEALELERERDRQRQTEERRAVLRKWLTYVTSAAAVVLIIAAGGLAYLWNDAETKSEKLQVALAVADDRLFQAEIEGTRFRIEKAARYLLEGNEKPDAAIAFLASTFARVDREKWRKLEAAAPSIHLLVDMRSRLLIPEALRGSEREVQSASFSPDGTRIVTASEDGTARVWSASDGSEIAVLRRGRLGGVPNTSFSPDGTRIITAAKYGTVQVWSASDGSEIAVLRGLERGVNSASFSPDGTRILTASEDGTARVWSASDGSEIAVLRGHEREVNSASFSPDGTHIVTASEDGTARVWSASDGSEIAILRVPGRGVNSASFSPDGTRILTAARSATPRIWSASDGSEIAVLRGHEDAVWSASFSPDGTRIVTASKDGTARVWSSSDGSEIAVLRMGVWGGADNASFSPDGTRIVTAARFGRARIWSASDGSEIAVFRGHETTIRSASFSPDGTRIVTASNDGTARVWSSSDGSEIAVLRGHESTVWSASFSPDGMRIVTASNDGTARVWSASDGSEIAVLRGHADKVLSALFSPDGTRIVTASWDRTARVWSASDGSEIAVLRGHEGPVRSASFSPDGTRIVTASNDGTARIWSASDGSEIAALRGHEGSVFSASFSPDGTRIVTAFDDYTARIWSVTDGSEIAVLRGHETGVKSASFSPDGSRIVTAGDDTARLWSSSDGSEIAVLRGHERLVQSASFSPDGTRIVTASNDVTARIWSASGGSEIAAIRGHEREIFSASFSPDGTRIITASEDGTARVWDGTATFEDLIDWAIAYAERNDPLSHAQKCEAYLITEGCESK